MVHENMCSIMNERDPRGSVVPPWKASGSEIQGRA